jgi:hypothetical protein
MTAVSFTLEQLRAAPPEVRQWVRQQLGLSLATLAEIDDVAPGAPAAPAAAPPPQKPQPRPAITPQHASAEMPLRAAAMQQPILNLPPIAPAPFKPSSRPDPAIAKEHGVGLAFCSLEEAVQIFNLLDQDVATAQVFFELGRDSPESRLTPPLHAFAIADILRHTRIPDSRQLLRALSVINAAFQQVRGSATASLFAIDQAGHVYVHEATHRSILMLWTELMAEQARAAETDAAALQKGPGAIA